MITITLRQFVDAIRKNGLPQARGQYFTVDVDNTVVTACALGQATINLDIKAANYLNRWYYNLPAEGMFEQPDIVELNDRDGLSLEEIADTIEKWAGRYSILDDAFPFRGDMGFKMEVKKNAV